VSRALAALVWNVIALGGLAVAGASAIPLGDVDRSAGQGAGSMAAFSAGIVMTKTVGTQAGECAATEAITVPPKASVTYCYRATNTGDITFTFHRLTDEGWLYTSTAILTPGASMIATQTLSLTQTTNSVAEWEATDGSYPNTVRSSSAALVTVVTPSIALRKTVGQVSGECGVSQAITVPTGAEVTYCYQVTNTSPFSLARHSLVDSELGLLMDGEERELGPGQGLVVTQAVVLSATTVNTATWTAQDVLSNTATAGDVATVTVVAPSIALRKTVGRASGECAASEVITVAADTRVSYCYVLTNTGLFSLTRHSLVDNELGLLLDGEERELGPGQSIVVTRAVVLSVTTVNTATWTARDVLSNTATATDTATVVVYKTPPTVQTRLPEKGAFIYKKGQTTVSGYAWAGEVPPPFPPDPELTYSRIGAYSYYVRWSMPDSAEYDYWLYEATRPDFSDGQLVGGLPTHELSTAVSKPTGEAGTYYYRVKASSVTLAYPSRWSDAIAVGVPIPLARRVAAAQVAAGEALTVQVSIQPAGVAADDWHAATVTAATWGGWDWSYTWSLPEEYETPYVIRARAMDEYGNVGAVDAITVTLQNKDYLAYLPFITKRWPPVPYAPVLAEISNPEQAEHYALSWSYLGTAVPVLTYTVQESPQLSFAQAVNYYPGHSLSQTVQDKLPGIYYYRVRGHNAYGPGEWSNVVSTTVLPAAPLLNPIDNPGGLPDYLVAWTGALGVTSYVLQEAPTSHFTSTRDLYSGPALSYTVSGKTSGVYFYRVKSVYDAPFLSGALSSEWSNVVSATVVTFHDDFDDPSVGWAVRRTSAPSILSTTVTYQDGRLVTRLNDKYDFSLISPMREAPTPPYRIRIKTRVAHLANQTAYGIVFGGNGGTACPVDRSNGGDPQGCFYHYYRLIVVWSGDYLQCAVKRIDYHDGEDKGKARGVALMDYTWLHSWTSYDDWNTWEIRVKDTGFSLYVNEHKLFETSDSSYVHEPYYGLFLSTDEHQPAVFEHEYFYIDH
jgi:hypothetical protein